MQDRVIKLSKLVFDLEIQKIDLQKRLEIAESLHAENPEAAANVQTLHNELVDLKAKLERQEQALTDRETMLKVAAGKARAEVLAMKAKTAESASKKNNAGLIAAVPPPPYMSPGKSHVDVATLQSMLRQKEQELGVLREDNSAKQKELLHALELLQGAHKREGELRCQAQSLANQLDLARDALQQSNNDVDTLQKEIEELAATGNVTVGDKAQSFMLVQLEAARSALAVAREDAEVYRNKAATFESALKASEEESISIQEKLAFVQQYLTSLEEAENEQERRGGENGRRAALGLTKTVLFARLAVQGLSIVCQAFSSS